MRNFVRSTPLLLSALALASCAPQVQPGPAPAAGGAAPQQGATSPAITAADLQTRLYTFAHDSMMGREAGTEGHRKAVAYLARELAALGLRPAGDNGTFFQEVPLVRRSLDERIALQVSGTPLTLWQDYAVIDPRRPLRPTAGARFVYGGVLGDEANMITADQARGNIVVFASNPGMGGLSVPPAQASRLAEAAGVAIANVDPILNQYMSYFRSPSVDTRQENQTPIPVTLLLTTAAANRLFGSPLANVRPGTVGGTVQGNLTYSEVAAPSQNVVAILPGTDPAVRGQYVAIGAHSDHDGISREVVDHDSLRAFNRVMRPKGANEQPGTPTAEQLAQIRATLDSLRSQRPARRDSIFNGADDDASGSVAMLEIAEAYARGDAPPRRSVLFVWHTAEEKGLIGAKWFTDHPTVPRDSIVAQINIDMIGRGTETDLAGGSAQYLQLLGSRRLSTELGDLVEAVNTERTQPFAFDYTYDAPGHPEQYYCRSDHAMYARFGIPVVFFSTGDHQDYHQLTDEPQYINYPKLANVTQFIAGIGRRVANLDHRLVVDQPKPDPNAPCRQ
jgi:hypothetical protein